MCVSLPVSRNSHEPVKGRLLPHPERGELHHLLLLDSWQSVAAGEGGGGWSGLWKVINTVLKFLVEFKLFNF